VTKKEVKTWNLSFSQSVLTGILVAFFLEFIEIATYMIKFSLGWVNYDMKYALELSLKAIIALFFVILIFLDYNRQLLKANIINNYFWFKKK